MPRLRSLRVLAALSGILLAPLPTLHAQTTPATEPGRVSGRVVDVANGQPLSTVEVAIIGTTLGARTDLDGRYTITRVPPGTVSVVARRIGLQPKRFDGVVVTAGQATVVNFSLGEASFELQSVVVSASAEDRSATEASLLSAQKRAASASDGVSAEQIKRSPDANAGEAATRVSGVSLVDGKYLIARGLSERYSATLLNGSEVASPEPTKKIVPLDVFPASLLESIVVTKSATPDKPGDFSGGAVEINTKEFPDNTVREFSFSQGYNSQGTFQTLPFPARSTRDFLASDNGRRSAPAFPPDLSLNDPFSIERFGEQIRNDWAPPPRRTLPNLGLGATLGGQRPSDRFALGYVMSLTYAASSQHTPDRLFQFFGQPDQEALRGFVYQDFLNTVDWGAVANLSLKLGLNNKLGLKNLYTRGSEELYSTNDGFNVDRNGPLRYFQYRYIERDLLQSQLSGDHLLPFLWDSRLEWKASRSTSGRDEPDNRQVAYGRLDGSVNTNFGLQNNNDVWFRFLDDRVNALQADWQVFTRLLSTPTTFKVGGLRRVKTRAFDGRLVSFNPVFNEQTPQGVFELPPELLFAPENVGPFLALSFPGTLAQPYDADDRVTAAYGMVDLLAASKVRIVTGARVEQWSVDLFDGGRARFANGDTTLVPTTRRNTDVLLSLNATVALSDNTNLRLAAFQSVSRPDTRELSRDEYTDVAGACPTIGNPRLQRARIFNADTRLEWYPSPGEVLAVSGFYKRFTDPIIRVVDGRNTCTYGYENAQSASSFGLELDARRTLSFLPSVLSGLAVSLNATLVETDVVIAPQFGTYDPGLDLEGQSPYLINAGLSYQSPEGAFSSSLLYNVFADRVVRYGFRSAGVGATQGPNIIERGRGTLDLKLQQRLGARMTVTATARNLTDNRIEFYQQTIDGDVTTGRAVPGVSLSVGVSVAP